MLALDIFYKIDLSQCNEHSLICEKLPNLNIPRTWHSMIFVPNNYIFIVGGSTKSVEIFDIESIFKVIKCTYDIVVFVNITTI